MGRGKLSLNLIGNRKCRMSTFKKRKSNLMKKAFELSTLCDVGVCVLIHGPSSYSSSSEDDERMMMKKKTKNDDDQFLSEFHTWPPNRTDVQSLLRACAKNPNFHRRKTFGLGHFFEDRRAKLLADTSKLRQDAEDRRHQFLCPNPNPIPIPDHDSETSYLQSLNELRGCLDSIDSKLRVASAMLHLMEPDQLDQLLCFDDLDQIGLCFDDLQPLLPEHDHNNDIVEFDCSNVLMNHDQFEFDCNVDEHLLLSGMDEFDFDNNRIHDFEFGNHRMPGNEGVCVWQHSDDGSPYAEMRLLVVH